MSHDVSGVVSLSVPLPLNYWLQERRRLVFNHACVVGFPNGVVNQYGDCLPHEEDLEHLQRSIDYVSSMILEQQGFGYRSKCENAEVA